MSGPSPLSPSADPLVPLPSPLVGVGELAAALGRRADLVVVDCRWYLGRPGDGRRAYEAGHVPGATHLDVDADLADLLDPDATGAPGRHPLPSPAAFAARLAAAGIGDSSFIVAYDDVGGWVAARLWWMLDDLGFRGGATVLDGGWSAWVAAGSAVSMVVPRPSRATARESLTLAPAWRRVIDRSSLKPRLGSIVLLDARAGERYRGEIEPIDPVAGHIPTALSAPIGGSLSADGRFLAPGELRARFEALGVTDGTSATAAVSCGSGVSACHHALAMRIAGLPAPLLYPGSYSDWSRSGEPVAVGAEPGAWPGA